MWPLRKKTRSPVEDKTYLPGTKTITVYPVGMSAQTFKIRSFSELTSGFLLWTEEDGTDIAMNTALLGGWAVKDW